MKHRYKPLPFPLYLHNSSVDGYGIYTRNEILEGVVLGETHYFAEENKKEYVIRTPLGGFINHSDNPNCVLERVGPRYMLVSLERISPGSELFIDYRKYSCCIEDDGDKHKLIFVS